MAEARFPARQLCFQSNFKSVRSRFQAGSRARFDGRTKGQFIQRSRPAAMLFAVIPLRIVNLMQTIPGFGCWVGNKSDRPDLLSSELHVAPLFRAVHVDNALR